MGFVDPGDVEAIETAVRRTLETKEPYSFFYRIHRRDGEQRILHSRGYLASDPHGDPISIFGTTQDVTESRRAEATLQMLGGRLIHARDDERRRVAGRVHENTAQDLARLKKRVGPLRRPAAGRSGADRAVIAWS